MASPPSPSPTSLKSDTIRRLQTRNSYMANAPFQQHKSKRKFLHDKAMKLCPVFWFAPAIVRAHDKHEYEKDKKHVQDVYVGYQEHKSRKDSFVGAGGRGSIVDLHTYPAPVEWAPAESQQRDPWRSEKVEGEDPWLLRPPKEIV